MNKDDLLTRLTEQSFKDVEATDLTYVSMVREHLDEWSKLFDLLQQRNIPCYAFLSTNILAKAGIAVSANTLKALFAHVRRERGEVPLTRSGQPFRSRHVRRPAQPQRRQVGPPGEGKFVEQAPRAPAGLASRSGLQAVKRPAKGDLVFPQMFPQLPTEVAAQQGVAARLFEPIAWTARIEGSETLLSFAGVHVDPTDSIAKAGTALMPTMNRLIDSGDRAGCLEALRFLKALMAMFNYDSGKDGLDLDPYNWSPVFMDLVARLKGGAR